MTVANPIALSNPAWISSECASVNAPPALHGRRKLAASWAVIAIRLQYSGTPTRKSPVRMEAIEELLPYMKGAPGRVSGVRTRPAKTSAFCTISVPALVAGLLNPAMAAGVRQTTWPNSANRTAAFAVSDVKRSGERELSTAKTRMCSYQPDPCNISIAPQAASRSSGEERGGSPAWSLSVRTAHSVRLARSRGETSDGSTQYPLTSMLGNMCPNLMAFSKSSMVPRRIELLASMTYGHPEVEPKTALPRPKVKSGTAPRLFRVNSLGTVSNAESTISSEIKTRVPSTLAP